MTLRDRLIHQSSRITLSGAAVFCMPDHNVTEAKQCTAMYWSCVATLSDFFFSLLLSVSQNKTVTKDGLSRSTSMPNSCYEESPCSVINKNSWIAQNDVWGEWCMLAVGQSISTGLHLRTWMYCRPDPLDNNNDKGSFELKDTSSMNTSGSLLHLF